MVALYGAESFKSVCLDNVDVIEALHDVDSNEIFHASWVRVTGTEYIPGLPVCRCDRMYMFL